MNKEQYQKYVLESIESRGFKNAVLFDGGFDAIEDDNFQTMTTDYRRGVDMLEEVTKQDGVPQQVIENINQMIDSAEEAFMAYVNEHMAYPPLPNNVLIKLTKDGETGFYSEDVAWEMVPQKEASKVNAVAAERISKILGGSQSCFSYETELVILD